MLTGSGACLPKRLKPVHGEALSGTCRQEGVGDCCLLIQPRWAGHVLPLDILRMEEAQETGTFECGPHTIKTGIIAEIKVHPETSILAHTAMLADVHSRRMKSRGLGMVPNHEHLEAEGPVKEDEEEAE